MSLSGSGILWINSGVNDEQKTSFSYDAFVEWYEEVHIGDVMHAGQLSSARRYARVDNSDSSLLSSHGNPFLVIYDLPDLSFGSSESFRQIPMGHARLPGGGPIGRLATFHAVFGRLVKEDSRYSQQDPEKAKRGRILVSEVIEWETSNYKNESESESPGTPVSGSYLEQSRYRQMSGWVRSTEYAIVGERWVGKSEEARSKTVGDTTLIVHELDEMDGMDGTDGMDDVVDGVECVWGAHKEEKAGTDSEISQGERSRETRTGSDDRDKMRGEIGDIRGRRVDLGMFRLVRIWAR